MMKMQSFATMLLLSLYGVSAQAGPADSLRSLDLQNKGLQTFPKDVNVKPLRSLYLGYNPVTVLPDALTGAKKLETVMLDEDKALDMEQAIGILKGLHIRNLSVNNCNLLYLPVGLADMRDLRIFSASNNYITELPAYLVKDAAFENLLLAGNRIGSLPPEMAALPNLKVLDLSENPCISDAATYKLLAELPNLDQLSIRGAAELPENAWTLPHLAVLDISNGSFQSVVIPASGITMPLQSLSAEHCDRLDFKSLLPLLSGPALEMVSLGGEQLNSLEGIKLSPSVRSLRLSGNDLKSLSFDARDYELTELQLQFNTLSGAAEICSTVAGMKRLGTLNLTGCNLETLPAEIARCKNVDALLLGGNHIKDVAALYPLKQLKKLDLSQCPLTAQQVEELKKKLPDTKIIAQPVSKTIVRDPLVNQEQFTVNPSQPITIITKNKTVITIPANSLVYADGKPVKDPVKINYTPYYSLGSIAASGINMSYNENGQSVPFSSAGMFNISAQANGKSVDLKSGKEMQVQFQSTDTTQSYNYYQYDSTNATWTTIGADKTEKARRSKPTSFAALKDSLASVADSRVPKPPVFFKTHAVTMHWDAKKKNLLANTFTIYSSNNRRHALDTARGDNYLSEIATLEKENWVVDEKDMKALSRMMLTDSGLVSHRAEFDRHGRHVEGYYISTIPAKDVEFDLIPDRSNDNFVMKFYNRTDTLIIHAYPAIDYRSIDKTQKEVKKMFDAYASKAEARKAVSEVRRHRYEDEYVAFARAAQKQRRELSRIDSLSRAELAGEQVNANYYATMRLLSLRGMGTFNCDRPVPLKTPVYLAVKIYGTDRSILSGSVMYIDPKSNIYVSYNDRDRATVPGNTILTVVCNAGNGSTYLGKLNTMHMSGRQFGKLTLMLSPVGDDFTMADLDSYISTIPK